MKVLLLAGGLGSRLAEETVRIPKPMVEVGGRPIIVRVMDIYSHFGHKDFLVAAGYKSLLLKQFFMNFHLASNDVSVDLETGTTELLPVRPNDWKVSIVDTGSHTMTGGRVLRLRDQLQDGPFMVTYSDGVGNIDIDALLKFHKSHGKLATVTAVQPPARFGNLELDGDQVSEFTEKVRKHETWINGGFFVFEPGVIDYIDGDSQPLELEPLTRIARDGQLMAYKHHGFWHPMDTVRDRDYLDTLCGDATPPWLKFDDGANDSGSPLTRR
ncbi:glucose-1-phosphate cytidylyltransferase [Actibacterium lipolyticum]|uniref:Glucose-1-phosphate cytidylyltransferase n=1 Tax=Actibacterium lipolyticum TaxID=1524263 RepID=A0A238KWP7_9RHOB|nr:glucose-1-phosphate cytidylyltransferase [Actibacterium lipolyticum]SMX47264.1 Glucose-1-phosphate cytidylyltransferase [Actibacterium lipolyticum]